MTSSIFSRSFGVGLALVSLAAPLVAQGRGVEIAYGRWWLERGVVAESYSATWYRRLVGPLDYGLGLTHLNDARADLVNDARSLRDRTQTGGELSLVVGGRRAGLYGVTSVGLGMRHDDGDFDAQWSLGAGYAIRPFPFLRLGLEARFRAEDQDAQGFWRLGPDDRTGLALQAGLALRFGGGARRPASGPGAPRTIPLRTTLPSSPASPDDATTSSGATDAGSAAATAYAIVQTALDQMGTPYVWGGNDDNGFDCSGLIQYAYGEHGIIIPRVSRDQVRTGVYVDPEVGRLRPGDILGFAVEGRRVSHVGLYVGEGRFIHSASGGVAVSSLISDDPYSQWWQRRWVAARRIVD